MGFPILLLLLFLNLSWEGKGISNWSSLGELKHSFDSHGGLAGLLESGWIVLSE